MQQPRVYVADRDRRLQDMAHRVFRSEGVPVECHGSFADLLSGIDWSRSCCVVAALDDVHMSGLELLRRIRSVGDCYPVIFVGTGADLAVAVQTLRQGAADFLEKPVKDGELLESVVWALERADALWSFREELAKLRSRFRKLTRREHQVMEGMVAGKTSKVIATELGLSKKTVDAHRARLMRKLEVESLAGLVEMVVTARRREQPVLIPRPNVRPASARFSRA